jgi:exopolyphosphatase/guanosine-5'-triphosphate,3'-diphosphate pyrophosphatase
VRTAVVDIGTNSTRLLIAEIEDGRVIAEPVRRTTVTRLGDGVDASGHLREDAINRVFKTLEDYASDIERHRPDKRFAVLTSAVRDATNGEEFANRIKTRYGLQPHILTGDEEARLTFIGATSEHDPDDRAPTLVADIGGGSTELVTGIGRTPTFHASTQAGVVRQSERHLHDDPPTPAQLQSVRDDVRAILDEAVPEDRRKVERAIAVAGTPTSLAGIAQRLEPYDPAKVQGYVLTAAEIERYLDALSKVRLAQRRHVPGLHPDRAPTIVAGVAILIEVLHLFGLDQVEVSEHDILRGAALALSP